MQRYSSPDGSRPVSKEEFLNVRNSFLTSATPIQSPQHLKGRHRSLKVLVDALSSPGRHAFIYGYRGVGKSSLSQTAAYQLQLSASSPIVLGCDATSTFSTLCRAAIREALKIDPLERKGQFKLNLGASFTQWGGANFGIDRSVAPEIQINSATDAVEYFKAAVRKAGIGLTVVIDEFDRLRSQEDHARFAALIKTLSDQTIPVKLIFCGISDTIDRLFSEHESIVRQIHSEKVEQLGLQARLDIIDDAEKALRMEMRKDFKYRIAQISDGFPSFVHLIAEKVFTAAFDNGEDSVSAASYQQGLEEAVSSIEFSMKQSYEKALHKNTRKYEPVIWALANDKLLELNIDDVWKNYLYICDQIRGEIGSRDNLITKLNQLTHEPYGRLLSKPRRSNYTFTEKMMRGYARLRAARDGCTLGPENPAAG